ncbi:hypothetical protein [Candidatus Bandiella numerosa]|jgi:chaperonin cofactor prefoldin|uniref:hypothetical protein n=1 Tax=Candidatus Bandiella numerosa TaxID=2570586 RepID=UPI001F15D7E0|nr:hypothetical protein [Candidatus Bandiella numerosa]
MEQKKFPTYKELYKECEELKVRVSNLEDELSDAETALEEINKEASYGSWNYYGGVGEFDTIRRLSKK